MNYEQLLTSANISANICKHLQTSLWKTSAELNLGFKIAFMKMRMKTMMMTERHFRESQRSSWASNDTTFPCLNKPEFSLSFCTVLFTSLWLSFRFLYLQILSCAPKPVAITDIPSTSKVSCNRIAFFSLFSLIIMYKCYKVYRFRWGLLKAFSQ